MVCIMDFLQNQQFFFSSNFDERSAFSWIENRTNFQIFQIFIFRVMVKIHRKLTILSTKMIISQKLKIWKLIFHSCQHISHLSCKFVQFWKKKCYSKFIQNWPILCTKTAISLKNLIFTFSFDSAQCEKSKLNNFLRHTRQYLTFIILPLRPKNEYCRFLNIKRWLSIFYNIVEFM